MKSRAHVLLLTLAISIGIFSRFYGINWDQGLLLHPDERFLAMVTQSIQLPEIFFDYFDTAKSTLNPHNVGYDFYVYGTLPIFLIKVLSLLFSVSTFAELVTIGRFITGILDVSIIIVVYLSSQYIYRNKVASGLSALLYSLLPLPSQLSHFYTVDTFLTFFVSMTFLQLLRILKYGPAFKSLALLGILFGMAVASKYSAFLFLPIVLLGLFIQHYSHKKLTTTITSVLIFFISAFVSLHLFQPYLFNGVFVVNPQVISDIKTLKSFENPSVWFPPAIQWINQQKIVFPLINLFWFGIGPTMLLLGLVSILLSLKNTKYNSTAALVSVWILFSFLFHATGFSMTGRYFYPAIPFISLLSGYTLYLFHQKYQFLSKLFLILCILPLLFFVTIYSNEHPRIQATKWILSNIPPGSVLSCEEWDDCLPLVGFERYSIIQLPIYADDSQQKMSILDSALAPVDYLVISSNRGFASITSAPLLYPRMSVFYDNLFTGKSDFKLIAKFSSPPNFPLPFVRLCISPPGLEYGIVAKNTLFCNRTGITILDDFSEEAYTVYDHPQVYIFKRNN